MIESRLIDLTFQVRSGKYDEVVKLAEKRGIKTELKDNVLYLRRDGYSTAVSSEVGEPQSTFACLAMAFFGPLWPFLMPTALERLDKEWIAKMKSDQERRVEEEGKQMTLKNWR
ncbi:MAG: hypothetical protein ACXQTL_03925 [Methanosarcinales archaeon]